MHHDRRFVFRMQRQRATLLKSKTSREFPAKKVTEVCKRKRRTRTPSFITATRMRLLVRLPASSAYGRRTVALLPPVLRRQLLRSWPHLVERIAVPHLAVLHHV